MQTVRPRWDAFPRSDAPRRPASVETRLTSPRRTQSESELIGAGGVVLDTTALQDLEQVFLSRLAESQSVEGEVVLQSSIPSGVGAQRVWQHCPVDAGRSGVQPVRRQLPQVRTFVEPEVVGRLPWVQRRGREYGRAVAVSDIAADRETAVAVDAPFALFKVDGVRGRVPMDDRAAPPVEVDALLPTLVVAAPMARTGC